MTIADGRVMLCALDESGDSPSSSCGGAGKDGRLLTREREAETFERERDLDRVTPVTGDCSAPGLNVSMADAAALVFEIAEGTIPYC